MIETKNAVITNASLYREDHGLLDSILYLDYGGSGQGFGGWALYLPKGSRHYGGPNYAGHWIWRVLEIAGVEEWSKLKGRTIRVRAEHSKVHAIGHIVRDDWFEPAIDFKEMERASSSAD